MAGEILTSNSLVLVKIEVTPGVDALPTVADAVLVESIQSPMGMRLIESTEMTGSLDAGDPQAVGAPSQWTITARMRGAVGAITAVNLPPLDPLLRASGLVRKFLSSIAAAALTAGTATSATLPAGFAATAQEYRGAPLLFSAGSHAGKVAGVTDYTAGKVATLAENYSPALSGSDQVELPAAAVYTPSSAEAPTVTVYHYRSGKLRKLLGAKASISGSMDTGGFMVLTVNLSGSWGGETDAAIPGGAAMNSINAPLFVQGTLPGHAYVMDRKKVALANFQFDMGVSLVSPPDPNTLNGFGAGIQPRRDIRLTLDPQQYLVATRNVFDDLMTGRTFPLVARAGTVAGNRMQITVPMARSISQQDGDREGVATDQLGFKASGIDSGLMIAFY